MNKTQAVAMLELIADLYVLANGPDPAGVPVAMGPEPVEDEVTPENGYREVTLQGGADLSKYPLSQT